jgi:ubiquinone/menaquinone biosynthesis C-methylase UbiE
MKYISLATIEELFKFKSKELKLDNFPGYSDDQWGIKAHNRPWIEEKGDFSKGQKIIEVGGGYSSLPKYLAEKYVLEAWVGDDFGIPTNSKMWSRWGDPIEHSKRNPGVKYVFKNFGLFLPDYPDQYFDRIFTVSTLEHIPEVQITNVLKDMHRCLHPKGMELHTIDIKIPSIKKLITYTLSDQIPFLSSIIPSLQSEIMKWINIFRESGVEVSIPPPRSSELLSRKILVESADVVFRFYPPHEEPKKYNPSASLLIVIESSI